MTYNSEEDRPDGRSRLSPQDQDLWDYLQPCPGSDDEEAEDLDRARTWPSGRLTQEELEAQLGFLCAEEVEALRRMGPGEVRRFLDAHT